MKQWENFKQGKWQSEIDVADFIECNYTEYTGDDSFLASPTEATKKLCAMVEKLDKAELENGGVLDADESVVSTITSHKAGYLDKDLEKIVGFQTDKPFKRSLHIFGGVRMSKNSLAEYGFKLDEGVEKIFTDYRKTHNQGVFDSYTDQMKLARKSAIITGLPDAYGRGRIIGDYRRVALYGVDYLIEQKTKSKKLLDGEMTEEIIRDREEYSMQIKALNDLKTMASFYGFDVSAPASNAKEAIQFLYFGYLAAIKDQNGAAMSLGRTSTFLDIYIERDMKNGVLTEEEAQELMDHFVMKLRLVKFMRTHEYNNLFAGDPTWVTESIGGMGRDGRSLVTKNSFRVLHTLVNLGPSPEPNLTVLWSPKLPLNFKNFCSKTSINTSSIQYESDELMRPEMGCDYSIACCVSSMKVGKDMQFFGARANVAKCLLYAINGGVDEKLKLKVANGFEPITDDVLSYDVVLPKFLKMMDWVCDLYVQTLNIIHYMHDKYSYEAIEMSLHDDHIRRFFATGIAGLSCVADSLSAIKYAKVTAIRDEDGVVVDYKTEGEFPKYGNNDDRVDDIAKMVVSEFMNCVRKHKTYRNSVPSMSVLTITSNVVYGQKTGNTPDGRKMGEPFAPGANPMHGRDSSGALASLQSVAKLPYNDAKDGISNTFSIVPASLGKDEEQRINNLTNLIDGYIGNNGFHLNINVFNRETLIDAQNHPEKYPQLTIRVSGYAVKFIKLSKQHQDDVIARTMHERF